ncbi:CCAAT- binding transcription factor component [Dimargaris cristalligena]|nr:CCAAT- binding transcription factor component [Dimargaris cristalligena]
MADQSNSHYGIPGQVPQAGGPYANQGVGLGAQSFMDPNLQLGLSGQAPSAAATASYLTHGGTPSSAHGQPQGLAPHQQQHIQNFWNNQIHEIQTGKLDFKVHQLPLARIKKVMKTDDEVKMISAEAPILFAKSCEIMILELTLRAWLHAEENKRRTLQRSDIASAITKTDMFDFLIDIVPREELNRATPSKSSDKPDFNSNLPHEQPTYSYMTYHVSPTNQYPSVGPSPLSPTTGQPGMGASQAPNMMQFQYLRNHFMQPPGTPTGVNPGHSPAQSSQMGGGAGVGGGAGQSSSGLLQQQAGNSAGSVANLGTGQGGHPHHQPFYSQQYAAYGGQPGDGSQPLMSPHGTGGNPHYGHPPRS